MSDSVETKTGAVIRTPEERFRHLPGFPFAPRYVEIGGLRIHYVDEGQGDVILCLHGVLEWSYSYRRMIPLLSRNHRVIVMDFPGFGRSDKFADRKDHTLETHTAILSGFIDALSLDGITLVGTDWGAVVGLCVATERQDLFERLVIMNTMLPTGEAPPNFTFTLWKQFVELAPDLIVSKVISMGLAHGSRLSKDEIAAYEAPFPDPSYKAGAIELPLSLPVRYDDPGAARIRQARDALSRWSKPCLVLFSDEDMLFSKERRYFLSLIPTAREQPQIIVRHTGHFLHDEAGPEVAGHVIDFINRTPIKR